jgi:hypothetical protein
VPEKQLHGSRVARFLIYLCRLGPSHRMRAIGRAIKSAARDPRMDDPGILPGRQVRLRSDPLGKRCRVLRFRMSASHAWIAARVCSVISNCTGRPVFF